MGTDKKVLYTISGSSLAALLVALLLPGEHSGRITAAILLLPIALLSYFFIKKRSILSINKKQILLLMSVIAAVCVALLFIMGLEFGFYKNPYFKLKFVFSYVLPIAAIVVFTEIYRWIIRAQEDKYADVLSYFTCVIAEMLVFGNVHYITTFSRFMDLVGLTLFPAIIANLLYHYLSKRYGAYPNMVYRLVMTLHVYILPIRVGVPDALLALARLLIPIAIFIFIDSLYEKKRKYALVKNKKLAAVITAVALVIMISVVALISNQFRFGTLVIATDSMTGEINKADAVIFEEYTDQIINDGQVIVFEKNDSKIVHRVVKIEIINGQTRYYTKGDANEDNDVGFITKANIVGLVRFKIPYIGYPTIWMRSLFDR